MEFMVNTLTLTVRFAVTLMIASMGEMFNQKAGIFNLGCEGSSKSDDDHFLAVYGRRRRRRSAASCHLWLPPT